MVPRETSKNQGNDHDHMRYLKENFTEEERQQAQQELERLGSWVTITARDLANYLKAKRNGTDCLSAVDNGVESD